MGVPVLVRLVLANGWVGKGWWQVFLVLVGQAAVAGSLQGFFRVICWFGAVGGGIWWYVAWLGNVGAARRVGNIGWQVFWPVIGQAAVQMAVGAGRCW